jgi:hypothetical protein
MKCNERSLKKRRKKKEKKEQGEEHQFVFPNKQSKNTKT